MEDCTSANLTGSLPIPSPPITPNNKTKGYSSKSTNRPNNALDNIYHSSADQAAYSPLSIHPPLSPTSRLLSTTSISGPSSPTAPPFANGMKPRSKSFAIPNARAVCPRCGLYTPSSISDQGLSITPTDQSPLSHRAHLPLHLRCHDSCPDTAFPSSDYFTDQAMASGPGSPYHRRHHRRRRSSLCYTESLVEDAEVIDSGQVSPGLKASWQRQAEGIAKNMLYKPVGLGLNSSREIPEEAIEE